MIIVDMIVCILSAALMLKQLLASRQRLVVAIKRNQEVVSARGVAYLVKSQSIGMAGLGSLFIYAGFRADFGWLWMSLGVLLLAIASILGAGSRSWEVNRRYPKEASPEWIEKKLAEKKRAKLVKLVVLLAWVFSWRGLVPN